MLRCDSHLTRGSAEYDLHFLMSGKSGMPLTNHNVAAIRRPFPEAFAALALCCAMLLTTTAVESADPGDIVVRM